MALPSTFRKHPARAALPQAAAGRGAGVVVAVAITTVLRRTSALS